MKLIRKKIETGFTLIEMLIAIFILGIGVIGILAAFSASIKDTSKVTDETVAAIIAESVKNSVKAGFAVMKPQEKDKLDTPAGLLIVHDGVPANGYSIALPADYAVYYYFPCGPIPSGAMTSDPGKNQFAFDCASSGFLYDVLTNEENGIRSKDPSDSFHLFSYIIGVRRVDKAYDDDELIAHKNYEFKVIILKGFDPNEQTGDFDADEIENHPSFLKSFNFTITGK